jgi:sulfatase modifying factor 1
MPPCGNFRRNEVTMSAGRKSGISSASGQVTTTRMPYPIGLCWAHARQSSQPTRVYGAAEAVLAVMSALVFADVLDLPWGSELERILTRGPNDKGLARLAFGDRLSLLRELVRAHNGASDRVLPDLQPWWKKVDGDLLRPMSTERNHVAHGFRLADDDAEHAKAELGALLHGATWLQEVQLIEVRSVRKRRPFTLEFRRLQGSSPYVETGSLFQSVAPESFEDGYVYVGRLDGTAWALVPWLQPAERSVRVMTSVDVKTGEVIFTDLDPSGSSTATTTPGLPLPSVGWREAPWSTFLSDRRDAASGFRFTESEPAEQLVVPLPLDLSLAPGRVLGDYRLLDRKGQGGFASVWEAEDVHSGERCALKILLPSASEVTKARFEQELALMKQLYGRGCRNLLGPVRRETVADPPHFRTVIRMPLMSKTLRDRADELRSVNAGPTVQQVARWGVKVLETLEDMHAQSPPVVHRDIKPANLLLGEDDDDVHVSDLGIARAVGASRGLTRTFEAIGTERYAAREQVHDSRRVTGKADVFSLAVTLHELATGKAPSTTAGRGISAPLGELLSVMGHQEPDERPSATEALVWMREIAGITPASNRFAEREPAIAKTSIYPTSQAPSASNVQRFSMAPPMPVTFGSSSFSITPLAPSAALEDWRELFWWTMRAGKLTTLDKGKLEFRRKQLGLTIEDIAGPTAAFFRDDASLREALAEALEDRVLEEGELDALEELRISGCVSAKEAEEIALAALDGMNLPEPPRPAWLASAVRAQQARLEDAVRFVGETNAPAEWMADWGTDAVGTWATASLNGALVKFRYCPSGRFSMGSPVSEDGHFDDEGPQHEVVLTRGYWLSETPVTQSVWQTVMGNNPSKFTGAEHPVENVSWHDCHQFLARVNSQQPRLELRLPTEAEWEYACRAETTDPTWLGANFDGVLREIAWYDQNSGGRTRPVKQKACNPWGFYDMLGNVWEWCSDWNDGYVTGCVVDPAGPATGDERVSRGGSWNDDARYARAANRAALDPGSCSGRLGFRLARGR